MVSSGSNHRLLAALGATLWLLCIAAASALAAEPGTCQVQVNPRAAASGSVFVFNGSGFAPTELTLEREGGEPITHDLNVGVADAWEFTVRSRTGDEGTWTASFSDPALNCVATVEFRVTLSDTDLIDETAANSTSSSAPAFLYLAVVVFGFSGGVVIGRSIQRVRARA